MTSINDLAAAAIAGTSAPTKRGAFIVLEGLDRSGKTTQVKLLEQRFVEEGRPVKMMRFPDRSTTIGQMIDGYLKSEVEMEDHVIHLIFSANRWEAAYEQVYGTGHDSAELMLCCAGSRSTRCWRPGRQ
ncbi:thymidylate kinase-domain-containing protein [Stachybotrys elegans]|uniref:Thymidylate kinase-domain-containing protein n=1 Tax=Stachybotrys elegans TaxID=80388 RepID=A0A8K0SRZ8_9HYPO|nr:thymidylate kinase-domain-containing protein [Stachybotrys elegans]